MGDFDGARRDFCRIKEQLLTAEHVPEMLESNIFGGCIKENIVKEGFAGRPVAQPMIVVFEGHMAFYNRELCQVADVHIWIDAQIETCKERKPHKAARTWQCYEQYRGAQMDNFNVMSNRLLLTAESTMESLDSQAFAFCDSIISRSS